MMQFENVREKLASQYADIKWIKESGLDEASLKEGYHQLMAALEGAPKPIIKARTFEYLVKNGRIAIDEQDIFQDKLQHFGILEQQRNAWCDEAIAEDLAEEADHMRKACIYDCGAYGGGFDFSHTSPNTRFLMKEGFVGVLRRVEEAAKREDLTEKQRIFYEACIITWKAVLAFCRRLGDGIKPYNKENADALYAISEHAPQNIYEAMQLIMVHFYLHEYVSFTRVRTLGRLDVMLYPFYQNDIESGKYTKDEITEMLKHFLYKFWCAKVPFDLPFAIGGLDRDGNEATNEFSYLIVRTYDSLNIYSPKIHIRVSDKTPADFVKLVLDCIRRGNSSFVFVNDKIGIQSLVNVGIEEKDAIDYTPIGCYEQAVWGMEVGCTGTGALNLTKALEFVITNGYDLRTGRLLGLKTGDVTTWDELIDAVKKQITYMTVRAMDYVTAVEKKYDRIQPDLLLSAQYDQCVERGVDAYEGGAKYNNSSVTATGIASLTDSLAAIKRLVFDLKKVSLEALFEILKNNWQGHEKLRLEAKHLPEKYGNGISFVDDIAADISDHLALVVNGYPNGRGGVFKAGLFSIDGYVTYGRHTMATPDGRLAGEPLSKNLGPMSAMDRNGITALIHSVTSIDHAKFPNGSVLDIMLHPSAVQGEEGLHAFYSILMTYMKKGGYAIQGNVFNSADLREAQENPEKYRNLQVRVCGWNAYFVNLSKTEQDEFIKQAESI